MLTQKQVPFCPVGKCTLSRKMHTFQESVHRSAVLSHIAVGCIQKWGIEWKHLNIFACLSEWGQGGKVSAFWHSPVSMCSEVLSSGQQLAPMVSPAQTDTKSKRDINPTVTDMIRTFNTLRRANLKGCFHLVWYRSAAGMHAGTCIKGWLAALVEVANLIWVETHGCIFQWDSCTVGLGHFITILVLYCFSWWLKSMQKATVNVNLIQYHRPITSPLVPVQECYKSLLYMPITVS